MSDYISRDLAIQVVEDDNRNGHYSCFASNQDAQNFKQIIRELPSADVRENIHGEWIDTGSGQECSICKEIQYGYDNFRNFCPNCGADMRKPKDQAESEDKE